MTTPTHTTKEADREERDRNVFNLRSLLATDLCQYCGSTDSTILIWDEPENLDNDAHTFKPCTECNGGR